MKFKKNYQEKVVVEIQPLNNFYEAEEYHQKIFRKESPRILPYRKMFLWLRGRGL